MATCQRKVRNLEQDSPHFMSKAIVGSNLPDEQHLSSQGICHGEIFQSCVSGR